MATLTLPLALLSQKRKFLRRRKEGLSLGFRCSGTRRLILLFTNDPTTSAASFQALEAIPLLTACESSVSRICTRRSDQSSPLQANGNTQNFPSIQCEQRPRRIAGLAPLDEPEHRRTQWQRSARPQEQRSRRANPSSPFSREVGMSSRRDNLEVILTAKALQQLQRWRISFGSPAYDQE